jgi:hypothetical protein
LPNDGDEVMDYLMNLSIIVPVLMQPFAPRKRRKASSNSVTTAVIMVNNIILTSHYIIA